MSTTWSQQSGMAVTFDADNLNDLAEQAEAAATEAAASATLAEAAKDQAVSSASAVSASETAAVNAANAASTSETNAASSETNAAASASAASTSATAAATSASSAATNLTGAQAAQTAAEAAQTAAETAETNAEASETAAASSATSASSSASSASTSAATATTQASNASTSATNAATSETNAASSESAAATSATNAATSATAASTSASAASTSASNAATSETNASTSATNASNAQTAAETAQTAAESAQTSAEAAFDSFDDRYLGAKASAPTVDNDGDALLTGAMYYNSTSSFMYVYDGATWALAGSAVNGTSERQTYTATAGQTSFAATYDVGYIDVYLNGIKLIDGTDFTASNGTSVVLSSGAALNDTVDIVAYGTFEVANTYTQAQADALFATQTSIANMVETTDIGVSVQAYDADTTKNDVANTFTADQTISGELTVDSYNESYNAVTSSSNATTVDCETGNVFSHTLSENTTFTFSNPPTSGTAYAFSLRVVQDASASGYTLTWPTSVDWAAATAPTLTATADAVDWFVFSTVDGGTTWYGFVSGQALG